ncbi:MULTISPECIES: rod shape-determining protein MreC [unclassified Marinobacter]|uniref:rod shape-determining protein MreC n=1 Tax=unclassified Marinobacter TaxID=83889 RepID=UPI0026E175E3|nr:MULTISPECIES: rod shape-determining protein MreC [unclassified Marinobacter]MDO6443770.1 rod shape-determining protein MreC [Marinobacter sp. 2_MG-2023]MDO6823240.1 rod shape-determining protein MreC [Marinobacter sp. 1_MG-2023]
MFVQGPVPGLRLLLVIIVSATLIVADQQFDRVTPVRSTLATGLTPVYWLGNAPYQFSDWVAGLFTTREDVKQENEDLKARLLILERRALKYAALASENNELRRLMNSSELLDDRVIVSEVVSVSPDPYSHEIIINKGRSDGLEVGQAILDAYGLMGQVIQTSQVTSRVLLVSDSSHAVPVEVVRNGLRAVLLGTGDSGALDLVHVPDTADIREGDLLVSSGLGGRFPRGYPVAEVSLINKEPGEPFVSIRARPKAQLNQSRLALVVFPPKGELRSQPAIGDEAQPESSDSVTEQEGEG